MRRTCAGKSTHLVLGDVSDGMADGRHEPKWPASSELASSTGGGGTREATFDAVKRQSKPCSLIPPMCIRLKEKASA